VKELNPFISNGMLEAILVGGPNDMPVELRTQLVQHGQEKVKIPHYGGHEHFERGDNCLSPIVYMWTGRTRVAE